MTDNAKQARVTMCERFLKINKKDPEFKHLTGFSIL